MTEYLSIRQTAEKWGISKRRLQVLCVEGRISGASRMDSIWAIPANAQKRQTPGQRMENIKK